MANEFTVRVVKICEEIKATEKSYCEQMHDGRKALLKTATNLSDEQKKLLAPIEALENSALSNELSKLVLKEEDKDVESYILAVCIAMRKLDVQPYKEYVASFPEIDKLYGMQDQEQFAKHVDFRSKLAGDGSSFVVLGVQRVPRYEMFMKELVGLVEKNGDSIATKTKDELTDTYNYIHDLGQEINKFKLESDIKRTRNMFAKTPEIISIIVDEGVIITGSERNQNFLAVDKDEIALELYEKIKNKQPIDIRRTLEKYGLGVIGGESKKQAQAERIKRAYYISLMKDEQIKNFLKKHPLIKFHATQSWIQSLTFSRSPTKYYIDMLNKAVGEDDKVKYLKLLGVEKYNPAENGLGRKYVPAWAKNENAGEENKEVCSAKNS